MLVSAQLVNYVCCYIYDLPVYNYNSKQEIFSSTSILNQLGPLSHTLAYLISNYNQLKKKIVIHLCCLWPVIEWMSDGCGSILRAEHCIISTCYSVLYCCIYLQICFTKLQHEPLQSDNIHFTRPWSHLVFMQEITTLTSSLLQKIEYINTNKAILQSVCKKIFIHCVSCTNSLDKFQKRILCIV